MSKFGQLIDDKHPLLLVFFQEDLEPSDEFHPTLRDVAAAVGDQGKVIKIETTKNTKLTDALRVKALMNWGFVGGCRREARTTSVEVAAIKPRRSTQRD